VGGAALGGATLSLGVSLRGAARAVAAGALELLLPVACVACGGAVGRATDGVACGACWARLAPLPHPQCARCGHPRLRASCAWCEPLPPYVRAVRSVCWVHRGSGLAFVHALKYEGWHRVAGGMGERMARLPWPEDVVEERALLVPVPLAPDRLRERGYNQSALLARTVGAVWDRPVAERVLERTRGTATQTRLTPAQRMRNVANAFRVPDGARRGLVGAHVVLVDDVVTTAATLVACAAALREGGARIVSCLTFGRAPAIGDR
jgi:ComF family protein